MQKNRHSIFRQLLVIAALFVGAAIVYAVGYGCFLGPAYCAVQKGGTTQRISPVPGAPGTCLDINNYDPSKDVFVPANTIAEWNAFTSHLPPNVTLSSPAGQACTSVPNSCGMTNSGTQNSCGACSATTPADSLCGGACGSIVSHRFSFNAPGNAWANCGPGTNIDGTFSSVSAGGTQDLTGPGSSQCPIGPTSSHIFVGTACLPADSTSFDFSASSGFARTDLVTYSDIDAGNPSSTCTYVGPCSPPAVTNVFWNVSGHRSGSACANGAIEVADASFDSPSVGHKIFSGPSSPGACPADNRLVPIGAACLPADAYNLVMTGAGAPFVAVKTSTPCAIPDYF